MNNLQCCCCNNVNFSKIGRKYGYNLFQCSKCGFITTYPPPNQTELKRFYSKSYFIKSLKNPNKYGYSNVFSIEFIEGNRLVSEVRMKDIIALKGKSGSILDVGSAAGYFLRVAKKWGWDTTGVEINPFMKKFSQKYVPLNQIYSTFDEVKGPYDVITMWEYLEHVLDLDKTFDRDFF